MAELTPTAASDGSPRPTAAEPDAPSSGIGIEIETLANLPDAEDHAEHEFYRDNFTAAEIAYCLRQPSVKAAFGGLMAAKRAILKAGAAQGPSERLSRLEITHDGEGRPIYPGCLLSTTHTDASALAVCWWQTEPNLSFSGTALEVFCAASRKPSLRTRIFITLVLLSLLALFAVGLWLILQRAFR